MNWLELLALCCLGFVVCSTLIQGAFVVAFARIICRSRRADPDSLRLPAATVILPLRGADPWLAETLRGLASQDYPEYDVQVVLDGPSDSAREAVDAWLGETDPARFRADLLMRRSNRCSLKNNALIQVIERLSESREVIAILDGDVVPHATWLKDLVVPLLSDRHAGAATGNRWYMPDGRQWGSLVRYYWNAGAVVQMWLNQMAWAGSLAIKRSVIEETEMLDRWGRSLSTDAVVYRQLKRHGYRCVFAESVLMINAEEIGLGDFVGWVRRQLTTARLYHPGWAIVWAHASYLLFILACAPLTLALAILTTQTQSAVALLAAQGVYWGGSFAFSRVLERAIRRATRGHKPPVRPAGLLGPGVALAAMMLTHLVYVWALLCATWNRSVTWRGVRYRISGPFDIEACAAESYLEPTSERESLV